MRETTATRRRELEGLERPALEAHQLAQLNRLLTEVVPENAFYRDKLGGAAVPLDGLAGLAELPFTTKEELIAGGTEGRAANLTWPPARYARFHQTSGTRGRPLTVLDTADDWAWWIDCWQFVLDAAGVTADDRALLAFSFGPFIGFWSAHDALAARGTLVVPAGGMGTAARLRLIETSGATALFCTPTYALRMAEVAADEQIDLAGSPIEKIVVAGEPGGSLPAVRAAIEGAFDARLLDHGGATEVGPWGYGDETGSGLHVLESAFIAEFISLENDGPAADGELAHLVLTSLGRDGGPLIRYRTGDLVRPRRPTTGANRFVLLEGGVVGRADDMLIVRGVNIFPSSIEEIVRGFPEVAEFRITARKRAALDELLVEVEDAADRPERIARELELRLGLKVAVEGVPAGALPRFEAKSRRFVDER